MRALDLAAPRQRWQSALALGAAAAVVAIGALAIVAFLAIRADVPWLAPGVPARAMPDPVVALAFVLLGSAMLVLVRAPARTGVAAALAFAAGAVAATMLAEHAAPVDLGIDDWLVGGRPLAANRAEGTSPHAALALLIAAASLLGTLRLPRAPQREAASGLGGAVLLAAGLFLAGGHLVGTEASLDGLRAAQVPPVAALGVLGLGAMLCAYACRRVPLDRVPYRPWVALACLCGGCMAGLLVSHALYTRELANAHDTTRARAERIAARIEFELRQDLKALQRFATRWHVTGRPTALAWASDAEAYRRDFATLRALEWVDSAGVIRRVHRPDARLVARPFATTPRRRQFLDGTRDAREPRTTPVIPLLSGASGFFGIASLTTDAGFDGWLVAVYDPQWLLSRDLEDLAGFDVRWSQDGVRVAATAAAGAVADAFRVQVPLRVGHALGWTLDVAPPAAVVAAAVTPIPAMTGSLIVGLSFLGWALASAVRHAGWERVNAGRLSRRVRRTLAHVRHAEHRLQLAVESARQGLWEWSIDRDSLRVDSRWREVFGLREGEPVSLQTWSRALHAEDGAAVHAALDAHLAGRVPVYDVDYRIVRPDGSVAWVNARGRVYRRDPAGRALRMTGLVSDVSGRKRLESELREASRRKDVLLRELHHRVKNNLALVGSLFWLQERRTGDPGFRTLLREAQARLRALALVHESLYRTDELAAVPMASYVDTLLAQLVSSDAARPGKIAVIADVDAVALPVDTAIPVGLVINELVTNALKHAWPAEQPGVLRVALRASAPGMLTLAVVDDGRGMDTSAPAAPVTLGLELVRLMASQLDGTLRWPRSPRGTAAEVTFPDPTRAAASSAA